MSVSPAFTKSLLSTLGFFIYFSGVMQASAAALNVSQKPLMLTETVPPNLIVTLDDSGSMREAFTPESIDGNRDTRRAKSSTFNSMYYNPAVTYQIPRKYDANGTENGTYSTSFTNAYYNGYKSNLGGLDLRTGYRVSWWYKPTVAHSNTFTANDPDYSYRQFADNPTTDFNFDSGNFDGPATNGQSHTRTSGGHTYTVTRTSSGCTVSFAHTTPYNVSCTRTNNTYRVRRASNSTQTGVPAYYYTFNPAQCTSKLTTDDACYRLVFVSETSGIGGTDERQNFAIWYSFYRNRALATMTAARIAFANMSPSARLTWQSLNKCTTLDSSSNCNDNRFREFSAAQRGRFFSWLDTLDFNSGTPLRTAMGRAGEFLKKPVAWHKYPNDNSKTNTTANTYSCRPSYHVMMTDGIWNGNDGSPSDPRKSDGASFTLPNNRTYTTSITPYADSTNNTLADLAMHYWATDLNTNLKNDLNPYIQFKNEDATTQFWDPRNNPATWQHMVNFTMGLGLTRSLSEAGIEWQGSTFASASNGNGYENLKNGTVPWPSINTGTDDPKKVYDLWHAAINSRGEFFSVDSPDDMVKAFKDILNRIADRTTTSARPAVSAAFVADGAGGSLHSNVYATQFSSEDWSGELSKTLVTQDKLTTLWNTRTANQGVNPDSRNILMANPGLSDSKLKAFTWKNLSSEQQTALNTDPESLVNKLDGRGEQRLAYIRGSRAQEGESASSFRKRNANTVIGDIVNSSPVVVGTPAYLAYLADSIEQPDRSNYQSYATFREQNRKAYTNKDGQTAGRKEMIYVGSNDGMLHGFNAETGVEEFAFIPSEVFKNLHRLTGKNYIGGEHRFFVDGTPIVRDVYLSDTDGWRTVLVGTLRAGGKALFALDITDPNAIKLLWEFDSTAEGGDEDLGYTFAQPEIVRLHTGQWAVLQGNGYDSAKDKAALLIIDIKTGDLIKKITIPEITEDNITLPNGLSSVRGADNNGDGLVDYAYAGDLLGNLWRFDLVKTTSSDPNELEYLDEKGVPVKTNDPFSRYLEDVKSTKVSDFTLAYGGKPLFTARDENDNSKRRQPITIQPSLVRHPTRHGYLVLVGTGKYFENSDANVDTSRAMTLYGIWDRNTKRQKTTANHLVAENRTKLLEQSFASQHDGAQFTNEENTATTSRDIRLLSENKPKWYKTLKDEGVYLTATGQVDMQDDRNVIDWGWKLDMTVEAKLTGEMIVSNMTASGSILFLSSLTPNQDPCQAGADTWLYAVDAYSGGRTRFNVLDLNADKMISSRDEYGGKTISGMRFPAVGGFTLAPGNTLFGSTGAADPTLVGDDPNSRGRQSWHIIPEEYQ
ncbi:pilus assembly protein [Pseudomonas sp. NCCP-436]|uniref:pilus assembly protein n=1 Tax=Pseudomonas sp. NCCP-436 TaxID=2842481 RepID=UPI001D8BE197|nr:PilC/PilY family type IV pilus protein [Pseudomonas sp. NCCP-436]GIZ11461.1 type IV pilus biogenesis factor PilY1 [Pseudomonas sp. NCCP-436]